MFHLSTKSSVVSTKKTALASMRSLSGNTGNVTTGFTSTSAFNSQEIGPGMSMSMQQTSLDTSPTLSGFLSYKEEKHLVPIYHDIYHCDAIAGTCVDMMSTMPFSEFSVDGIKDKAQKDVFMESMERLNLRTLLPEISIDYLVTGTFVGSLLYNQEKKIFVDIIPHDFANLDITPFPFYGFDPIIKVTYPKEMLKVFNSNHPRLKAVMEIYGSKIIDAIKSGSMELDPISTIYLPRKTTTTSQGTSLYRRILPIYFLEKNLYRGTLMQSIKRQKAVTHITLGDSDWEPTPQDLEAVVSLFAAADSDPLSAVIATRSGVSPSELMSPTDFWKWTDTIDQANSYKLKCLGISEGLLSGDANYATAESSIQSFMEKLQDYRSNLTRKIFYEKIFPLISLVNDYYKDDLSKKKVMEIKEEMADHDIVGIMTRIQDTSSLMIPKLVWQKNLKAKGSDQALQHMQTLVAANIPVPARILTAAAGEDIQALLDSKEEDLAIQKELADWKQKILAMAPQPTGPSMMSSVSGETTQEYISSLRNTMAAYANLSEDAKAFLAGGVPYHSSVLNAVGKTNLFDRKFDDDAGAVKNYDANGKAHVIYDQKAANEKILDNLNKFFKK